MIGVRARSMDQIHAGTLCSPVPFHKQALGQCTLNVLPPRVYEEQARGTMRALNHMFHVKHVSPSRPHAKNAMM